MNYAIFIKANKNMQFLSKVITLAPYTKEVVHRLDMSLHLMGGLLTPLRLKAAWPRGRTPVLRSFGIVFESPRGRGNIFSSPARAGPIGNIESLGPLGAGVSVIAPLPERLPGLIEGSLRPQSSFEYSVPGSYLVVTKPP